jgi:hypothetical protein
VLAWLRLAGVYGVGKLIQIPARPGLSHRVHLGTPPPRSLEKATVALMLAEDAVSIPIGARLLPSRLHESWACSVVGAVVCWDLEQRGGCGGVLGFGCVW